MATTKSNATGPADAANPAVTAVVVHTDRAPVEIPSSVTSLAAFREWLHSDQAPERGRVDFIDGRIEIDMSPEELHAHVLLKSTIGTALFNWNRAEKKGTVYIDGALVVAPSAALSAEPDVVYTSRESRLSGRVRLIPKAGQDVRRSIELEGAPDLVVEVVSDSSVSKDRRRLFAAYFAAGIAEYWLADGRGDELAFVIHHRGETAFVPAPVDSEGYQTSPVLNKRVRATRIEDQDGLWDFDLLIVP